MNYKMHLYIAELKAVMLTVLYLYGVTVGVNHGEQRDTLAWTPI